MDQTFDNDRIVKINIEEEMKSSYIDYSMSTRTSPHPVWYDGYQQREHPAVQEVRPRSR